MAFQFPWTNLHELNLDWFLSKFKQFTDNYLGTTATAESVPYGTQPSVTVTGGELDEDTDVTDPFTFNFKIPAGQPGAQGEQGEQGVPGQDGFSPIATVTKSGTVATITITDVNGTTTTTISDDTVTQEQLDTKAPAITLTANGSVVNFSDGADNLPLSELIIDIAPNQSGSSDPAPDNIRPISGWTGCNVTRCGKNLLPQTNYNTARFTVASDGNVSQNNPSSAPFSWLYSNGIMRATLPAGTYTVTEALTTATTDSQHQVNIYNDSDVRVVAVSGGAKAVGEYSASFTLTKTTNIALVCKLYDGVAKFSIVAGSTAQSYETYQDTTLIIDWTTEAGTVYGGTLDVRTGLLTVTHQIFQVPATATWTINNNAGYTLLSSLGFTPSNMKNPPVGTANRTIVRTSWCKSNALIPSTTGWYATASSGDPQFVVSYDDYLMLNIGVTHPTTAQINQFITNVGLQLYYPLATAQTYQLTPQQLFNTLYGVNNVWSDTGDCSVTYTADTMLYIQNLTQPTEDDMVANTAIANGKFFMIGNNLYRATTAIASGSQIIPGTNATPMSLADALNLL